MTNWGARRLDPFTPAPFATAVILLQFRHLPGFQPHYSRNRKSSNALFPYHYCLAGESSKVHHVTMWRTEPRNEIVVQHENGTSYVVDYKTSKAQKATRRRRMMKGSVIDISLASMIVVLPMPILTAVLVTLVFTHPMPNHDLTFSVNNATEFPLGTAYYVKCSSTTLVPIASLSSTIATILISTAIIIFCYPLAREIAKQSDQNNAPYLPSPFQLQLLIRMIDGRLTALWSCLVYVCGGKQRKIRVVPVLWHAVIMMVALVLLA